MKVGIIGRGIVGNAMFVGLKALGHIMRSHDTAHGTSLKDVVDTDIVFICVPTNQKENGKCDTSVVGQVIEDLVGLNYTGVIAIKSTVSPGTTEKLISQYDNQRICFVPEFLKERSADADFMDNMDVLIVGTHDKDVYQMMIDVHKHLPKNVADILTPTEAEMAKYFCNVYNALRITFASGMYKISEKLGADYQKVFGACIKRKNIEPEYLKAGPGYLGFSGKCLPKDSSAFAEVVDELGLDLEIFRTIVNDNKKHLDER